MTLDILFNASSQSERLLTVKVDTELDPKGSAETSLVNMKQMVEIGRLR